MDRPSVPGRSAAEPHEHVVGNRPGVELLSRGLGPADPGAHPEALRAEPGAHRALVLHPKRLGLAPGDLRPDRQHIAVARGAQELRARLDDRNADDVVFRKGLGPRQPQRGEERLTPEVVPLEEARIEDDSRRVDVAPADLHLGRVLDHGSRGYAKSDVGTSTPLSWTMRRCPYRPRR